MEPAPLILATVGTDHHPFDRLVGWVDAWFREEGEGRARCVVQWGTSTPPVTAQGSAYLNYDELQAYMAEAAVVVTHGGPATIMECRRHGLLPIAVPRRADLGEHVDDHQSDFNNRLAASGDVHLCRDESELRRFLREALEHPSEFRGSPTLGVGSDAVERFARLVQRFEVAR